MKSLRLILGSAFFLVAAAAVFFFRGDLGVGIHNVRVAAEGIFSAPVSDQSLHDLELQNRGLEAELERVRSEYASTSLPGTLTVRVFSRYPLSDRGLLTIDQGSANGLRVGMPVLATEGILLGKIQSVTRLQSEVVTIFDPSWRSGVVVGAARTKAVLTGGATPQLNLLPKDAPVAVGDMVQSIAPDFPLDLLVGSVSDVESAVQDPWRTGSVEVSYDPENLNSVVVLTTYP